MTIIYITEHIKANALVWSTYKEGASMLEGENDLYSLLYPDLKFVK